MAGMLNKKTVDPKLEPVELAKLTSLVASCSFNEEELKWKPLPPIDSNLSIEDKRVELKRRRYSPELSSYLLDQIDVQPIDTLLKHFMDKSKSKCLYYTYVLVDPRSHDDGIELDFEAFIRGVFYIGEGIEGRCADHFFTEGLKGKCQICPETYVLEDMMMPTHKGCPSPKVPAKIQCADCLNFIEVQEGKFIAHPSLELCDAGLREYAKICHSCLQEVDVIDREKENSPFKLKPHERMGQECDGTGKSLTNRKCPVCREEVAVYEKQGEHPEGAIKPHGRLCEASNQKLCMGVCLKCKQSKMIYKNKTLHCVAGDMKPHPQACSTSGKLPPKIVLNIKDRKVSSIWKAGRMPTAVICSQGETKIHALQKEAMMMMAYGKYNLSSKKCGGYLQGKLMNNNKESEDLVCDLVSSADASECRKYGVKLFIKAWKTYRNTDKPECAARILWPRNPNEVQPSDDDDDDDDCRARPL